MSRDDEITKRMKENSEKLIEDVCSCLEKMLMGIPGLIPAHVIKSNYMKTLREGVWEIYPGYFLEITEMKDLWGDAQMDIHIIGPNGRATSNRFVGKNGRDFEIAVKEAIKNYFKLMEAPDWGDLPF